MLAPLIGLVVGFLITLAVFWSSRRASPRAVDKLFRRLQLVSAAAYSLGHGGNDAQKTMGIITALLFSTGMLTGEFHVPLWVVLISHAAIAAGTLFGGWRIVKTMGMNITKLKPVGGFCAETAGALTLFGATAGGHPGLDHAHHHRGDRRRRGQLDAAPVHGALGRGRPHRLGLGAHHAGGGAHRGGRLVRGPRAGHAVIAPTAPRHAIAGAT